MLFTAKFVTFLCYVISQGKVVALDSHGQLCRDSEHETTTTTEGLVTSEAGRNRWEMKPSFDDAWTDY